MQSESSRRAGDSTPAHAALGNRPSEMLAAYKNRKAERVVRAVHISHSEASIQLCPAPQRRLKLPVKSGCERPMTRAGLLLHADQSLSLLSNQSVSRPPPSA